MFSRQELNRKVATGALWTHLAFVSTRLITLVNVAVLARVLGTDDFGLVAAGLAVLALLETFSEGGVGSAVVWRRQDPEKTVAVAMTVSIIGALLIGGVAFFAAPIIASVFFDHRSVDIIRALSVCLLLSGPSSVFVGILQRDLAFRKRVIPEVLRAITKTLVGIFLALSGFGAWSLVYGHIAGMTVGLLALWWLSRWSPRLSLDRQTVSAILPFGIQMTLVTILSVLSKNADYMLVGHFLDVAALGIYVLAFSLTDQIVLGICWAASQALFPAYGSIQADLPALRRSYEDSLTAIAALTLPAAAGLAIVADPLVNVLYGEKWKEIIPVVQVLAVYAMVHSAAFNVGDLFKAIGRPSVLTWTNVLGLVLAPPVALVSTRWGIVGFAVGQIGIMVALSVLRLVIANRLVGIGPRIFVLALRWPFVSTLVMVGVTIGVDKVVHMEVPLSRLLVLIMVGIASYVLALSVTAPSLLSAVAVITRSKRQQLLLP
jgi:PST family polysaccharide transporter